MPGVGVSLFWSKLVQPATKGTVPSHHPTPPQQTPTYSNTLDDQKNFIAHTHILLGMSGITNQYNTNETTAPSDVPSSSASSSSSSATATTTTSAPSTTVIRGVTLNEDTGEEEEFTLETIPLSHLSTHETEKLASLARKVLNYFEQEKAEAEAEAETQAKPSDTATTSASTQ